jgi:hypothetical protein
MSGNFICSVWATLARLTHAVNMTAAKRMKCFTVLALTVNMLSLRLCRWRFDNNMTDMFASTDS